MTYDLSDDEEYSECPEPGVCTLDQQVQFYMNTYGACGSSCAAPFCPSNLRIPVLLANTATASIAAAVGYETGTPAYPDPIENPSHR